MSEAAVSVYEQIVEFARDPRCDHLMAAGFAMALMEERSADAWTLIDRERFLSADPAHNEAAYEDVFERSTVDGRFI